jgi:beta-glucosidase
MEKLFAAGVDQFGGEQCPELVLELVAAGRVAVERIDESVRRLLRVKFELGLFDNPYVDEEAAAAIVGRSDFVAAGHRAQAESVTVLVNSDGHAGPVLPLRAGLRLFVEGVNPETAARFATVVDDPAAADCALVRLQAPYEDRNSYFLEQFFNAGSLEFSSEVIRRLGHIAEQTPLVVDVMLDRPAILTPITEIAAGLVVSYGASDQALLAALAGWITPRGRLPFEAPRSMEAVVVSRPDVASDTVDPLFPVGHRIEI